MPLYEYRCEKCTQQFEVLTKSFDQEPPSCPKKDCPGPTKKCISKSSFVLKGGGWYKDSYQ